MNVYGSARRRLWPQVNTDNAAVVSRLDFGNRSRRLLVAEPQVRRAANEKKCRALTLSRLRHNSTSSRSGSSRVARLPQLITARATGSRKVENKKQKNQHPRRGHNNFGPITPAAPDEKTPEPLFLALPLVGRLCQTPIYLFVISKTFLIWPLFPVRGQTSANRILSNVIPFFVD